MPLITAAYDANNMILMGARVPQILQNFQTKGTGQLSIITFAANTLGCVARLFTTMQEGGGSAMMRSYAFSKFPLRCFVRLLVVQRNCAVSNVVERRKGICADSSMAWHTSSSGRNVARHAA